ncbi:MAG: pilus assembly protein [Candidatus Goldbacteria bacterium]|nr:pilus assembly protein [Candidatus Goldiibacteriota bacterium]
MDKRLLKSKKSQSMVEFTLVFPVFMLCVLGMIQLAIIFMNSLMLQYTAYMVARVAVVYGGDETVEKAERALAILKLLTYYSNSIASEKNIKDKMKDIAYDAAIDYGASYIKSVLNENEKGFRIDEINIKETANSKFIKVTVKHNLALKVPFVNKIFGLFNTNFRLELPSIIKDLLTLKIFEYDFSEITKVILNEQFPYWTLSATAIMRIE